MSYIDGKGNFYIAKLQTQIKDINKEIIIDPSNEYLLGGGCVKPIINEEKINNSKTIKELLLTITDSLEFSDFDVLNEKERVQLYPFSISKFREYFNKNNNIKFNFFKETIKSIDNYIEEIENISNNIDDIDFIEIIEEHFVDNSSDADLLDYIDDNEIEISKNDFNNYDRIVEILKEKLTSNSEFDKIAKCIYNMTEPRHYKAIKTIKYIPIDKAFNKTIEINNLILHQSLIDKKEITKKDEI